MSPHRLSLPLALLVGLALSPAVRAADTLSPRVENYIFAVSEALADGQPALALSLLEQARAEAPESCLLEEYLFRCHAALGDLEQAQASHGRFVACMQPEDRGILVELDSLLAQAEHAARQAPDEPVVADGPEEPAVADGPEEPEPTEGPELSEEPEEPELSETAGPAVEPAPVAPPTPVVPSVAPATRGGAAGLGWTMLGSGLTISAGATVAAYLSYEWGQHYINRGKQEKYERALLYNHLAVYGAAGGGAVALTGLVVGAVSSARRDQAVSTAPWVGPQQALGIDARVEF